jgi:hypothetical protein
METSDDIAYLGAERLLVELGTSFPLPSHAKLAIGENRDSRLGANP